MRNVGSEEDEVECREKKGHMKRWGSVGQAKKREEERDMSSSVSSSH